MKQIVIGAVIFATGAALGAYVANKKCAEKYYEDLNKMQEALAKDYKMRSEIDEKEIKETVAYYNQMIKETMEQKAKYEECVRLYKGPEPNTKGDEEVNFDMIKRIAEELYMEESPYYERTDLYLYKDGILCDSYLRVIDNPNIIIGPANIDYMLNSKCESMFIRNDNIMYELGVYYVDDTLINDTGLDPSTEKWYDFDELFECNLG